MLAIVLVFTAFGIPYASNNFVGTVVTVEQYLNSFSGWLLNFYNTIHNLIDECIPLLSDIVKPLGDLVTSFTEFLLNFEERYAILENTLRFIGNFLQSLHELFTGFTTVFKYFGEYGFNIFNTDWLSGFSTALKCTATSSFYCDDGTFDYDKMFRYVDALVYGAQNEFSYLLNGYGTINITNYVSCSIESMYTRNTVVVFKSAVPEFALKDDYDYFGKDNTLWFTTVDLSISNDYFPFMSDDDRLKGYLGDVWLPVADSNFSAIEDDGLTYNLEYFRLYFTANIAEVYQYYMFPYYGVQRFLELRFVAYDDVGKKHSKYITLDDYISDYIIKSSIFIGQAYRVKVLDKVYYPY